MNRSSPVCLVPLLPLIAVPAVPAVAQAGMAADANQQIDEIIVTTTRFDLPLDQVGRAVSVITEDLIELRQDRFVLDALRTVPGVQVTQTGSVGGTASVSIRGLESDQTLVVQDGIVLNNPASFGTSFNFANFDTSDVQKIEVVRGAQSTLYGSDAIGGIINIVTKSGTDGLGGSAFFEAGSFGTYRGAATLRGGTQRASARATVSGTSTRGFSSADEANGNIEDDGFENISVSSKGRVSVTDDLSLQAVLRYQDSENEFDSFDGVPVDGDEVGQSEELTLGGFLTYSMLDGRLSHRASVTYVSVDQVNRTDGAVSFDSLGQRLSYEYQGKAALRDWASLVFGAEYEEQEATTRVGFGGDQQIDIASGYGLLRLSPIDDLSVTGGIRHDSSDSFGSETTFSAAANYEIPRTGLRLRGSYSEGFRAPSAGELGFNPDLFAEFSTSWDVGLERSFWGERVRLGVTYFDQEVDDLIAFDLNTFTFLNIERFETSGVEVSGEVRFMPGLSLTTAYTYLDAFNATTSLAATNQPTHRFNSDIAYRPTDKLTVSLGVLYNGSEPDGTRTLHAFTVVSLRGSYALSDHLDLILRVENVTDADYQDNAGFGTAPISAFAGLRARF